MRRRSSLSDRSERASTLSWWRTRGVIRQRSSPLVRKIAKEHNVDISQLHGSGIAGRVTKDDILGYLGQEGREGREGQEGRDGSWVWWVW